MSGQARPGQGSGKVKSTQYQEMDASGQIIFEIVENRVNTQVLSITTGTAVSFGQSDGRIGRCTQGLQHVHEAGIVENNGKSCGYRCYCKVPDDIRMPSTDTHVSSISAATQYPQIRPDMLQITHP